MKSRGFRTASLPICLAAGLAPLAFAGSSLGGDAIAGPPPAAEATYALTPPEKGSDEKGNNEKSPSDEKQPPEKKRRDGKAPAEKKRPAEKAPAEKPAPESKKAADKSENAADAKKDSAKDAAKKDAAPKDGAKKEADDDKADGEKAKTHLAKPGPFQVTLDVEGTFEPGKTTEYAALLEAWQPAKGYFEVEQAVPHGARVKKGQTLAKLHLEDLERAVADAERAEKLASLNAAEAEVDLAALKKLTPMNLAKAERDVREAKEDLKRYFDVEREIQRESQEYDLKYARFSVKSAEEELAQLKKMYEADDLTEETEEIILERTKFMAEWARNSLKQSEHQYRQTIEVEMPRTETARKEATERATLTLEQTRTEIDASLKKAEIELARTKLAAVQAKETYDDLKADLEKLSSLKATSDGYVFYGRLRRGSWTGADEAREALRADGRLTPGQVFMTVVGADAADIRVELDEKDLHLAAAGKAGEAHPVAYPLKKFDVKIASVEGVPVTPGKFVAILSAKKLAGVDVVPGMKCAAEIVGYRNARAIAVPKSAVFDQEETGESIVYLPAKKKGGKPIERVVEKGLESGDRVEILSGLKAGEEILLEKPEADE